MWHRLQSVFLTVQTFNPNRPQTEVCATYSYLSASSGSTLVALRAGKYHANRATTMSNTAINENVTGSVALILKSNRAINRVSSTLGLVVRLAPPLRSEICDLRSIRI